MKRWALFCVAIITIILDLLTGCSQEEEADRPIRQITDMAGEKGAYPIGSAFVHLAEPYVKGIEWLSFNDFLSCLQALFAGKVDGTFADEPVVQLSVATYPDKRHLAKTGITMMIVTHEMRFARDVLTRIFYMDQGIIYEDRTPEEIFEHPMTFTDDQGMMARTILKKRCSSIEHTYNHQHNTLTLKLFGENK